MEKIEYVLDFAVELAKEMIISGANIERVNITMGKICKTYDLREVSIHSLSTFISISARDENNFYCQRQITVPGVSIDLNRFKRLNLLSHKVYDTVPDVKDLMKMLHEVHSSNYPAWFVFIAYLVAMASLGRIFGGGFKELLVIEINTAMMYGVLYLCNNKIKLNHIITDFVCMFLSMAVALLFANIGFIDNCYIVIITNAFYLIPGIPLVNAARNILCGNEMNGIIELLKVILEVVILVAGIASSFYFFVGNYNLDIKDAFYSNSGFLYNFELIFLSFLASAGFSVVFNLHKHELLLASLGGALTRIVYIDLQLAISSRVIFTMLAAFSAAVYSEILCSIKKKPSTVYLYPTIIPLIPGDLIYYTLLGTIWRDTGFFETYAFETLLSLIGISVGFVLASSFMHYIRRFRLRKFFNIKHEERIKSITGKTEENKQ